MKAHTPKQASPIWGEYRLTDGETRTITIGQLTLLCKRSADELWVASFEIPKNQPHPKKLSPDSLNWYRWAGKAKASEFKLIPAFPDRTIVVQPEHLFRVVQGAQVRIYVGIPVWIRIEAKKSIEPLIEIATSTQSKTWFGSPTEGQMCYWESTSARRNIDNIVIQPNIVICPVQIINESEINLQVEKLALHAQRLSVFQHEGQLWSDETRVNYRGKDEVSRVRIAGKPPAEAENATLICRPRKVEKKGFAERTFSTIKDLSSFEFLSN